MIEGSSLVHVLVLYVHTLLGEGLAKLLTAQPGMTAISVAVDDSIGRTLALASAPDVIVVERYAGGLPPVGEFTIGARIVFIDPDGGLVCPEFGLDSSGLEGIVEAIRRFGPRSAGLVTA
ncbi:MAG TPA: hypothetical protein VIV06_06925 [Candidatus Limnocylindrales bacterium]